MPYDKRNYSLDFIKIVGTILILFHHYQQITGAFFPGMLNFYNGQFDFGLIVEFFFVLSGYVIFPYSKKICEGLSFKSFYLRRASRLLPMVIVSALTFEILLYIYIYLYGESWLFTEPTLWGMLIDCLGLQAGWSFENPCVNNPTWYISVLMLCYAIYYFICLFSKRYKISTRYFYIIMIMLGCGVKSFSLNYPFLNIYSARGYYAFFTGLLLGSYIYEKRIQMKEFVFSLLISLCIILLICFNYEFVSWGIEYILTFILYPALTIVFSFHYIQRFFSGIFWKNWAAVSYHVYLLHIPLLMLMYIIIKLFNFNIAFTKIYHMLVVCLVIECISIISYYVLEKKVMKKLMKKLLI